MVGFAVDALAFVIATEANLQPDVDSPKDSRNLAAV